MHGNLFCIFVQRIPQDQDYGEYLAASNGSIDGPLFSVAIAHTTKDDEPYFYAYRDQKVIEESDDLGEIGDLVMEHLKKFDKFSKDEEADLLQIICIQDDADYDLDSDAWLYSVGNGGEVLEGGDKSFDRGLVVNVMPIYDTPISESGEYDPDVQPADHHEFCGIRRRR
jgi:hypothetical protein